MKLVNPTPVLFFFSAGRDLILSVRNRLATPAENESGFIISMKDDEGKRFFVQMCTNESFPIRPATRIPSRKVNKVSFDFMLTLGNQRCTRTTEFLFISLFTSLFAPACGCFCSITVCFSVLFSSWREACLRFWRAASGFGFKGQTPWPLEV